MDVRATKGETNNWLYEVAMIQSPNHIPTPRHAEDTILETFTRTGLVLMAMGGGGLEIVKSVNPNMPVNLAIGITQLEHDSQEYRLVLLSRGLYH